MRIGEEKQEIPAKWRILCMRIVTICIPGQTVVNYELRVDEMGGASCMRWTEAKCIHAFGEKT
jgi:hypothetical protein